MTKANIDNTLIILPVFNCANTIADLLTKILSLYEKISILCINDGSTDNSLDIIKNYDVEILHSNENHGKGKALKMGFNYAQINNFKFVLTLDGDLQHDPHFIYRFFTTQNIENSDLVIGLRRFSFLNMPFDRVCSNYLTSKIVSYITNYHILDSQSGYRLYNIDLFNEYKIYNDRFQMETELLFDFCKKYAKISYVEIPVIYNNEKSNISHLRDIKNFIKACLDELL
jgi:glycosyltransferase involved in cell wall biosynthesis